jgi:hypothetical protein
MTQKKLEECPVCSYRLGVALSKYFWQHIPGNEFAFDCPNCKAKLEIEVEAQPWFYVSLAKEDTQEGGEG